MEPSAPEAARAPAVRAAATAAAATRMRMGRLGLVVMAVTSDSVWEQREARARRCSSTRLRGGQVWARTCSKVL